MITEMTSGMRARLLIGEIKQQARDISLGKKLEGETYTQTMERLARENGYRTLAALQALAKQP